MYNKEAANSFKEKELRSEQNRITPLFKKKINRVN